MRCPTCRRRLADRAPECSRCGTDLTALLRLDRAYETALATARAALAREDLGAARDALDQAQFVCGITPEIAQARAIHALLKRDFPGALHWRRRYQRGRRPPDGD